MGLLHWQPQLWSRMLDVVLLGTEGEAALWVAVCCLMDWVVEVGWGKVSELGARLVQLSGMVSLVKQSLSAGDFEPPTVTQPTGLGVDEVATTVVLAFKALTV